MYLKFFLTSSVVNLWFNSLYAFIFYSLICGSSLYANDNTHLDSIIQVLFWSVVVGTIAMIFTQMNCYINSQLVSLSQNFFTIRRLIAKTAFYALPLLLALIVNLIFDPKPFYFRILDNPLIYLIWILPYEVFEYLRLEYQKSDEV
jgi:hypothetical protein